MSDYIEPDFADAIYEFACKLPQTIRPDILAFVVVYATGKFNEGDDVLLRLKNFSVPQNVWPIKIWGNALYYRST
jgi:hypothetical protein